MKKDKGKQRESKGAAQRIIGFAKTPYRELDFGKQAKGKTKDGIPFVRSSIKGIPILPEE